MPIQDPAELFPADTLFYAELVRPGEVARDLRPLLRRSMLDDLPSHLAKMREKNGDDVRFDPEVLGLLATALGPEMLSEAKRLHGAAFAITGIDKKGDPEFAAVVLSGESNLPGLAMRFYLSSSPFIRPVAEIEGVKIYLDAPGNNPVPVIPPGGVVPQPLPVPEGPCFAQVPGAVIIGGSKASVGNMIRRLKKKEMHASLLQSAGFADATALRGRPGLFLFANPARLTEALDSEFKSGPQGHEQPEWTVLKELVNPKAIRSLAASLSLNGGHADLQLTGRLHDKQASPLFDLFVDQQVDLAALQPVPANAEMMLTLPLRDAAARWQKLVAAADVVAKAAGQIGAIPSEAIKDVELKLKTSLGPEVLGKITALTLAIPAKQELPKRATAVPMLLVNCNDVAAAEQLERVIPPLVKLVSGADDEPVTETVRGLKIRSVSGTGFLGTSAMHYGRRGATLVIGQDRKLVAASLHRELKESLAADPRFLSAIDKQGGTALLGCWQWAETLAELSTAENGPPTPAVAGRPAPAAPRAAPKNEDDPRLKRLVQQGRNMLPLIVSLSRGKDELRLSVHQANFQECAAKLLDGGIRWMLEIGDNAGAQLAPAGAGPPAKN
jgi:hypothetical protein